MNELFQVSLQLNSLTVYRALLEDETVSRFARVLTAAQSGVASAFLESYGAFLHSLSQAEDSLNFSSHLEKLLRYDDNAFSRAAARGTLSDAYKNQRKAALYDLESICSVSAVTFEMLKQAFVDHSEAQQAVMVKHLPEYASEAELLSTGASKALNQLEEIYLANGFGLFAEYGAFRWDHALIGICHPDPVRLSNLKSYEYERGLVAANTRDFVEKHGGGNLLLYGDRGTGQSSTIKALANEYRDQGLRIVEVTKDSIPQFPQIMEKLREVPLRFILFLDDLSFSTDDASFSALKSVLEGGVVARPENCLIYATSNRRHLVKESFSERSVDVDDVHASDTKQEKLSLYDRFDQTVNFFAPDQAQYLSIVRALAQERTLPISKEELDLAAIRWAIRAGGRSPRVAKQFVEWAAARSQKGASILDE